MPYTPKIYAVGMEANVPWFLPSQNGLYQISSIYLMCKICLLKEVYEDVIGNELKT